MKILYISIHVQDADTTVLDLKILYTGVEYFLQMKISFMSRSFIGSASIPCIYIYRLGRILSSCISCGSHLDDKHMVVVTNQGGVLAVLLSVKPTA